MPIIVIDLHLRETVELLEEQQFNMAELVITTKLLVLRRGGNVARGENKSELSFLKPLKGETNLLRR